MRIFFKIFCILFFLFFKSLNTYGIDFSFGLIANNFAFQACGKPVSNKLNTEGIDIVIEKKGYKNYTLRESKRDTHPKCIVIKSVYADSNNFEPTLRIEQNLVNNSFLKLSLDVLPTKIIEANGSLKDSSTNTGYNKIYIRYYSDDILLRIYSPNFKKEEFSFQPFIGSSLGQRKLEIKLGNEVYYDEKMSNYNPQYNYNLGFIINVNEHFFTSYTNQVHINNDTRINHYYFLIAYVF